MKKEHIFTIGIAIPLELFRDPKITLNDSVVFAAVMEYSKKINGGIDGFCVEENSKIADICKIRKESVSNALTKLTKKGYIKRVFKKGVRYMKPFVVISDTKMKNYMNKRGFSSENV